MSEGEFWECSLPAFTRLLGRHRERGRVEDYRFGILASIASSIVGKKALAPAVFFPSLAEDGKKPLQLLRREDLPADWKVTTGAEGRAWMARLEAEKAELRWRI